jgi:uncharacterized membrane protein (UPF0127 family)
MKRSCACLLAGLWLAATTVPAATRTADEIALDEAFGRDAIVIEATEWACWSFDVYMALDMAQQRRGLMTVRKLPMFTGMLFVYADESRHSMWMKNTFIPLDILFIRMDGTVSSIARHTEPQSLRSIASSEPVGYVLELNAGLTEDLHIDDQSHVLLPADLSAAR